MTRQGEIIRNLAETSRVPSATPAAVETLLRNMQNPEALKALTTAR